MKDYIEQIETITKDLNDDQKKFLQLGSLKRLINKLDDQKLQPLTEDLDELIELLKPVSRDYTRRNRKPYIKKLQIIKKKVKEKYGYIQKGTLFSLYFALCFSMGTAMGVVFDNIAMGTSLGLLAAAVFSLIAEKDAEKKGLLY